jgi:hypothetical protein
LLDDWDQFVFDEGASIGANEELIFGEEGIELDEVNALILECHSPAILDQKEDVLLRVGIAELLRRRLVILLNDSANFSDGRRLPMEASEISHPIIDYRIR